MERKFPILLNACPNCGYGVKVHFDNLKRKAGRNKKKAIGS